MHQEAKMRAAIAKAKEGILSGQSPFGSAIFRGDELILATHNTVWKDTDPTAHAEVNNIRQAAAKVGAITFEGCEIFATCEPCPMCLTAIHWAKFDRVVYGATIADAMKAGFSELQISAADMVEKGKSPLIVESGCLQQECQSLFEMFKKVGKAEVY